MHGAYSTRTHTRWGQVPPGQGSACAPLAHAALRALFDCLWGPLLGNFVVVGSFFFLSQAVLRYIQEKPASLNTAHSAHDLQAVAGFAGVWRLPIHRAMSFIPVTSGAVLIVKSVRATVQVPHHLLIACSIQLVLGCLSLACVSRLCFSVVWLLCVR